MCEMIVCLNRLSQGLLVEILLSFVEYLLLRRFLDQLTFICFHTTKQVARSQQARISYLTQI